MSSSSNAENCVKWPQEGACSQILIHCFAQWNDCKHGGTYYCICTVHWYVLYVRLVCTIA